MRQCLLALALALLALAPACSEGSPSEPTDDRTRGERCDDMQSCGRSACNSEIQAVRDCVYSDPTCGDDPAQYGPLQEALATCLEDCNTTTCDLVEVFTNDDEAAATFCDDPADAEVLSLARRSLFVTLDDEIVAECQALE